MEIYHINMKLIFFIKKFPIHFSQMVKIDWKIHINRFGNGYEIKSRKYTMRSVSGNPILSLRSCAHILHVDKYFLQQNRKDIKVTFSAKVPADNWRETPRVLFIGSCVLHWKQTISQICYFYRWMYLSNQRERNSEIVFTW